MKFETMRTAFLEAVFKIGATKSCPKFAYGSLAANHGRRSIEF